MKYSKKTGDNVQKIVVKLTFLIIMTKKGNLIPNVFFGSAGQEMKVVLTFVPIISSTDD